MYFCGMPAGYFADPDQVDLDADAWDHPDNWPELRPWGIGLAKLRLDGWAYLQLARETDRGQVTTLPFVHPGGELVVNGSGLGRDGIRVEVLSPDSCEVIPGFGVDNCVFDSADSVNARVTWLPDDGLTAGEQYRLRFVFGGLRAKLYAFGFSQ